MSSPQPAYMDLEDSVLEALGDQLGMDAPADTVHDDLVTTVRATVDPGASRGALLAAHTKAVRGWARTGREHPPNLPLLAVFSLAAEHMARGDGLSSANYYGRLAPLLGLERRRDDLAWAYRSCALSHWSALNRWLSYQDGRRGLPTAFSLGADNHRYVGLAMSQAVVRDADRARLVSFFQAAGFPARAEVQPDTLQPLLDAWIAQRPSPATHNLQRLWRTGPARERIADAASVLLASWDGIVAEDQDEAQAAPVAQMRLACMVAGLLARSFEARVLAYLPRGEEPREVTVVTAEGDRLMQAQPTGTGPMVLLGSEAAELDSLLDGVLRCQDPLTGTQLVRRPRRLVPLRRDDLLQQHVEVDQVQLGEDLMLLVEQSLLPRTVALLDQCARPGWSVLEATLRGLPRRYCVIRDVQLMALPEVKDGETDLRTLVPLARSQLVLSGGFSVPGRMRRWSSLAPPEARVVDDHASRLSLQLRTQATANPEDDLDQQTLAAWSSDQQVLVVDLAAQQLHDGDYELAVYRDAATSPSTRASLRLRSAAEPDALSWEQAPSLVHDVDDPLWTLTAASHKVPPKVLTQGAVVPEPTGTLKEPPLPPGGLWWESETPVRTRAGSRPQWRLAAPDPTSCMYTGRHYLLFPPTGPGQPRQHFIEGRCRDCGAVKRGATSDRFARRQEPGRRTMARAVHGLRGVASATEGRVQPWQTALDVLGYLGGGPWSLLERVALQVEASALFVDQFGRSLESLGHLEIRRDPTTLAPIEWEVAPSAVAGLEDGDHVLCGYWTPQLRADLGEAVRDLGGRVAYLDQEGGPRAWFVLGVAAAHAQDLAEVGAEVVPDAGRRLAGLLPPLSRVVEALHVRPGDLMGDLTWFSTAGACWVDAPDLAAPGAYRVRRHTTVDVLRTPSDVREGVARTSTVQVGKHAAALLGARPLAAYDPATRQLVVPLGADLPGAYGRAAVLASGLLPVRHERRLVYEDVPTHTAALIIDRLGS